MSIKIPVSAELNQQAITQQIDSVRDALNSLGKDAQGAGKIKFEPINKVSLENVKKMRTEFDAIVKMSPGLKKALAAGGQGGKSFDDVQWNQVFKDEKQRREHANSLLRRLLPEDSPNVKPTPDGRPGPSPDPQPQPTPGTGSWRRAGMGAVAGIAGGVASQIGGIGGGAASGALAGGLAGGPLGAAVGGLAGAITSLLGAIGESRDIAVSLDTLKRTLGDTNVSFKELQDSTRGLADEYSLADAEASALTKRYANLSGSEDVADSRNDVGVGVGFSRSFGLDPSAGVGFFGQMRGMGITQSADDSKKLALMIGESVAKAGDLPRLGDVLAGLTRYMEGAARTSLTAPNSAAWLSQFAGLEKSGLAGMDPTTAASIIGSIDGSIRQGGITEAGRNFMNGTLQRDQGLNTIQAAIQLEGGAFGTGRSTFGADSPMSRFYSKYGGGAPLDSWNSDESNVSVLQRNLVKQYEGKPPELMLDAFKNTFGTSYGQSAAWMASDPEKNDNMLKRMQRLGINWKDVNATGVSRMSQIESNKDLSEADKDTMIKEAASKNQEDTIGSEARRASIDGGNAMVRLATEGLPMLSSIQAGVLKIAGLDPQGPQKDALKNAHEKRTDEIENGPLGIERGEAVKEYNETVPLWKRLTGSSMDDKEQRAKERMDLANADLSKARDAEKKRYDSELADLAANTPAPPPTRATSYKTAGDEHITRLEKIKKEQGAEYESAQASFEMAVPEDQRGPDAQLDDEQTFARDRMEAAKADYDSAMSTERDRFKAESGTADGVTPELLKRAAESDRKAGLPAGTTAGLMMQESSFNSNAESNAGAKGLHQIMPDNVEEYSRRVGRKLDPTNTADSFYMYDELMAERRRKYGNNTEKVLRSYHGGYDEEKWGDVNEDYVPAIERRKRELAKSGAFDKTPATQPSKPVVATPATEAGKPAPKFTQIPLPDKTPAIESKPVSDVKPAVNDQDVMPPAEKRKRELSENGAQDELPAIERRKRELAANTNAAPSTMTHKVDVDVTMRDLNGNQMNNAAINTTVGKPLVSGQN